MVVAAELAAVAIRVAVAVAADLGRARERTTPDHQLRGARASYYVSARPRRPELTEELIRDPGPAERDPRLVAHRGGSNAHRPVASSLLAQLAIGKVLDGNPVELVPGGTGAVDPVPTWAQA